MHFFPKYTRLNSKSVLCLTSCTMRLIWSQSLINILLLVICISNMVIMRNHFMAFHDHHIGKKKIMKSKKYIRHWNPIGLIVPCIICFVQSLMLSKQNKTKSHAFPMKSQPFFSWSFWGAQCYWTWIINQVHSEFLFFFSFFFLASGPSMYLRPYLYMCF